VMFEAKTRVMRTSGMIYKNHPSIDLIIHSCFIFTKMDMDIHNFIHQLGGEDIRCQKSLVLAHHTTNQEV